MSARVLAALILSAATRYGFPSSGIFSPSVLVSPCAIDGDFHAGTATTIYDSVNMTEQVNTEPWCASLLTQLRVLAVLPMPTWYGQKPSDPTRQQCMTSLSPRTPWGALYSEQSMRFSPFLNDVRQITVLMPPEVTACCNGLIGRRQNDFATWLRVVPSFWEAIAITYIWSYHLVGVRARSVAIKDMATRVCDAVVAALTDAPRLATLVTHGRASRSGHDILVYIIGTSTSSRPMRHFMSVAFVIKSGRRACRLAISSSCSCVWLTTYPRTSPTVTSSAISSTSSTSFLAKCRLTLRRLRQSTASSSKPRTMLLPSTRRA